MVTSCKCKDTNECISRLRCLYIDSFLLQFIQIQYNTVGCHFSLLLAVLWSATQHLQGVRHAGTLFSDHFTITYFAVGKRGIIGVDTTDWLNACSQTSLILQGGLSSALKDRRGERWNI